VPRILISAGGLGLVITLFSTTRGSRPRSRLLAEPLIIDSHNSPSSTSGSTPLIRAVPSRRIELAKLSDLRDRGIITEADFQQGKEKVLRAA